MTLKTPNGSSAVVARMYKVQPSNNLQYWLSVNKSMDTLALKDISYYLNADIGPFISSSWMEQEGYNKPKGSMNMQPTVVPVNEIWRS